MTNKTKAPITRSLFLANNHHDPQSYPQLTEMWRKHENAHWSVDEIHLTEDKQRWVSGKIDNDTKQFLTNIFRFFTQADEDVHDAYADVYMPMLKNQTARKMMSSFFAREATHVEAYKKLVTELGMPDTIFKEFLDYKEMQAKHDYLKRFDLSELKSLKYLLRSIEWLQEDKLEELEKTHTDPRRVLSLDEKIDYFKSQIIQLYRTTLVNIGVFSAFTEGMHLFSSFVMLLNLCRHGVVTGMHDVIKWSILDETLHYEGMLLIYNELLHEISVSGLVDDVSAFADSLQKQLTTIAEEMVALEDAFVDLCFGTYTPQGLTKDEMRTYTRYICDRRLISLGCEPIYGVKDNPLPWVDVMLSGNEHTNFFEAKATAYNKAFQQPTMLDEVCEGMKGILAKQN